MNRIYMSILATLIVSSLSYATFEVIGDVLVTTASLVAKVIISTITGTGLITTSTAIIYTLHIEQSHVITTGKGVI